MFSPKTSREVVKSLRRLIRRGAPLISGAFFALLLLLNVLAISQPLKAASRHGRRPRLPQGFPIPSFPSEVAEVTEPPMVFVAEEEPAPTQGNGLPASLPPPPDGPIINPHPFRLLHSPTDVCSLRRPDVFVLAVIHSAPGNYKRRMQIRETFGSQRWYSYTKLVVIFAMGMGYPKEQESIRLESDLYQDIVQENFLDSYKNLTYKGDILLMKREKVCIGAGIQRILYFAKRKVENGETELSPFVLIYAHYPTGTQPGPWPIVMSKGKKTVKAEKALRMRPSLLHSLTDKVKATRDLGSAKQAYCDEQGGVENLAPGQQISQDALKKSWQSLRAQENLPRLGRGGSKSSLDDPKLRASLNRNADLILMSQLEINPAEEMGIRIAIRAPLAVDDFRRLCLAQSDRTFRSGMQAIGTKFPRLLSCQDKLLQHLFGLEVNDGREDGPTKKRSRIPGLTDCISTSLRDDWASLRSRLEEEVTGSEWGPEEEADDRLAAFHAFSDHAERYWLGRWEMSFCLDSRHRFYTALGEQDDALVGKVVTNLVESLWPEIRKALEGRLGAHEILDGLCGFLRRHWEFKKAAILGMESDHIKINPEMRADYALSTAEWTGSGRERAKARALAKVWPSLASKAAAFTAETGPSDESPPTSQSPVVSMGGIEFGDEAELAVSAAAFPLPLFSPAEAQTMDKAAHTLITAGALTKLSDSYVSVLVSGQPPFYVEVREKVPLLLCKCKDCNRKSAPFSAVTAHTLAAAHTLGTDFAARFEAQTVAWMEETESGSRGSLLSANRGKKGPMARRRHGPAEQQTLAPPDRLLDSSPAKATLHKTMVFIRTMPSYVPMGGELRAMNTQRRNLFDPVQYKHHNDSPVFLIRLQDLSNKILSNYKERICVSCLRRLTAGLQEPGDLIAIHEERMLQCVERGERRTPELPSLPPADSLAVGKRWESWERAQELQYGYRYSRPSNLYSRAYHATYACLAGRLPYLERSQIRIHTASEHNLSAEHRAYLNIMFGMEYPHDTL